ncbi:hypothetical protein [Flindersiella endophytica]
MSTVLSDPAFIVPSAPDAPTGIGWLRSHVVRFSEGPDHLRRRAQVADLLAKLDPAGLRAAAERLAREQRSEPVAELAAEVTVTALADALGLAGLPVGAVKAATQAYQPGSGDEAAADEGVEQLVAFLGGEHDEPAAARICVLVQACAGTTALAVKAMTAVNAARAGGGDRTPEEVVADTLEHDQPLRQTRRVDPATGEVMPVDLSGLPFGAGRHACPGGEQAVAIAAGIVAGLR